MAMVGGGVGGFAGLVDAAGPAIARVALMMRRRTEAETTPLRPALDASATTVKETDLLPAGTPTVRGTETPGNADSATGTSRPRRQEIVTLPVTVSPLVTRSADSSSEVSVGLQRCPAARSAGGA